MTERYVFRMCLNAGMAQEYQRRHDAIWPEFFSLLHKAGVSGYSIYLDAEANLLIGVLELATGHAMNDLSNSPVMQKWWVHMTDVMETGSDNAPVAVPLARLFHMP